MIRLFFIVVLSCCLSLPVIAQKKQFTKDDTLLGSNHAFRSWWDVLHYDLTIKPDYKTKTISGKNIITYSVLSEKEPFVLQLDLQEPMQIDCLLVDNKHYTEYKRENNRYILNLPIQQRYEKHLIAVYFSGKPHEARNPPWDGGWVWKKDSLGNPWMSVACQGNGPSIWYPCKDLQSDESTASLNIIVPDSLTGIGNGKLISTQKSSPQKGLTMYQWQVVNPINNYNIVPYIGKYTLIHDSIQGENGKLITDYWVLNYHKQKAIQHLKPNVTKTIKCFEHWFGPYPFYEDSYKIVEAPYLGMEHQSNVAYGNFYLNGYAGRDLSKSGWGLKWDFIVVHESGHEWFGNSITAEDVADNWIHEGFTSYSEVLFTECEFGKEAGNDYCEGVKKSIDNDTPIIGKYGVHSEGSGDMYNKGSQVVHMIRQIINNDDTFIFLLHRLNAEFYHRTATTEQIEAIVNQVSQINLTPIFNQYLRTTQIPRLEYKLSKKKLMYRYSNCIENFSMPLKIKADKEVWITPTTTWQTLALPIKINSISIDRNFYVDLEKVKTVYY